MSAYILIDGLSVTDPKAFSAYQPLATAAVEVHGGRFVLPLGAQIEPLEGNWRPNRIVVIEFEDGEDAMRWWSSPEYAEARALHRAATISNIILIDGAMC
jgi:uncharacterized protein (DUF1330 family)